ncbi:MAG: hypothetical protein QXR48_01400 [Candidatus Woesearchaeota archaeon]
MRWNKKGALELSITAIVVLIIAITVLGLAIFFIKNLFKGGTEIFTGEMAKIKDQLRKNIEESGDPVVFSKGTELEAKRGEKVDFYIGVRNSDQSYPSKCYRISMRCKTPLTPDSTCTPEGNDVIVGGHDVGTANWFPRLLKQFEVKRNDIEVLPVTMQVIGAPDTYQMVAEVYQTEGDCNTDFGETPWQEKRFYIVLS